MGGWISDLLPGRLWVVPWSVTCLRGQKFGVCRLHKTRLVRGAIHPPALTRSPIESLASPRMRLSPLRIRRLRRYQYFLIPIFGSPRTPHSPGGSTPGGRYPRTPLRLVPAGHSPPPGAKKQPGSTPASLPQVEYCALGFRHIAIVNGQLTLGRPGALGGGEPENHLGRTGQGFSQSRRNPFPRRKEVPPPSSLAPARRPLQSIYPPFHDPTRA